MARATSSIVYYGENDRTVQLITEVVERLPPQVREFTFDRCCFASVGGQFTMRAQVLPGCVGIHPTERKPNMWIIILDENLDPANPSLEPNEAHIAIAYEIALAWLLRDVPMDCRIQAAKLLKRWGFIGEGSDAKPRKSPEGDMRKAVYYGRCAHTEQLITETVQRLEAKVRDFVLDRCRFVSVGNTAQALPGCVGIHPFEQQAHNMWIIILEEGLHPNDDRRRADEAHSIVAHEIAHAWLGHDRLGNVPPDCEGQAADQARQWGFTGKAADAEYCMSLTRSGRDQRL